MKTAMTVDERRIANAALGAGPWDNHDQIVIAVADGLGLDAQRVESVLQRLRIGWCWSALALPLQA